MDPAGPVPPDVFIPVIERTPAAGLLTYWVIDTVAAELLPWLAAHPTAHVGINVPPAVLGRGAIQYAGEKCGLWAHAGPVIAEVTERGPPDEVGVAGIRGLRAAGVRVALDDVAMTGVNAVVLARCQFDVVKIDKAFVRQLAPDLPYPGWPTDLRPLRADGRFTVIAEGVETAFQAAVLAEAGVPLGPGFYFCRPVRAKAFQAFHAAGPVRAG